MAYTQEQLEELIAPLTGEVLEQEAVYGGKRPVVIEYNLSDNSVVQERFAYAKPADSDEWAAVKSITLTHYPANA